MNINSPIQTKKSWSKNIALGLAMVFSVATVGLVGTTYAQGGHGNPTNGAPTVKADCKKGGWMNYGGFKNQGQCVAWVNAHGYGGNNGNEDNQGDDNDQGQQAAGVSNWLNLDISGDNNVVNVVINYIFG